MQLRPMDGTVGAGSRMRTPGIGITHKPTARVPRANESRPADGLHVRARFLLASQRAAGNRAVSDLVQRWRGDAPWTAAGAPVQRAKGDRHTGKFAKRGSDGALLIQVWIGNRPKWFKPPADHGLVLDQTVTFVEGDDDAVTELAAEAPPKTYTLFDGRTKITDSDILRGVVHPIEGRTNGDVELVITSTTEVITIHVHPYAGSGSTPTGGGVKIGRNLSLDNAPQEIVNKIREHKDFDSAVKSADPKARADASAKQ